MIAVIKAINLISGYVMRKEIVALHTGMNKATGILLFVLPLTFTLIDLKYSGAAVCAAATFAAIQEGHLIRSGKRNLLPRTDTAPQQHCCRTTKNEQLKPRSGAVPDET